MSMFLQLIVNGIISGSIYALIAISFTVIYRTVKFLHIAHGGIYTLGAYLAYTFLIQLKMNFVIGFILSVICSAIIGFMVDRVVYFPLRCKNAPNLVFLLASFGVFILLQNFIQLIFGSEVLTIRNYEIIEGFHIWGFIITQTQISLVIVSIVLMLSLWVFIHKTTIGKSMRAVSDDPMLADVNGIDPERIIASSFIIGSALAGIAGILVSLETNIEPTMGFIAILKGVTASIIGGIGSIPGAILGSFFLGLVENLSIWKIPTGWKDVITFSILIFFLLVRPTGFLGVKMKKEKV